MIILSLFFILKFIDKFKLGVGKFYIMKSKKKPTVINCVEELKNFCICGYGKNLYISNQIPLKIVESFIEIINKDMEVTIFDYREIADNNSINLKKNGRTKIKLNKKHEIYKQTYYYYSKNRIKYITTMIPLYIKKYCCYTRDIQNYRFMQSKIFYASYENTADLINAKNDLNITRQSVYLYEREACRINLVKKEQELWKIIKKLEITVSGIYHYDEEYIKVNKEVYVRLSLIDAHTRIIINDILITKDQFNKECIKSFFITSLDGFPLDTIITDGYRAYPQIIDEIGAKHQLCRFHIMENLMKPVNKRINILERKIKSFEKKIEENNQKIHRLKAQYPYKQGRPPKEDNKAQKNINNRKNLKRENSEYTQKLSKYNNEKTQILYYKERIKKIFDVKSYKTGINKINKLLDKKDELPDFIHDFLKNLLKKIERALAFTKDESLPKTNNLVELFYKITFPGKIKRIYRTIEGAMNRIRLNNIKWMEKNVIERHQKIIANQ